MIDDDAIDSVDSAPLAPADSSAASSTEGDELVTFTCKWRGQSYELPGIKVLQNNVIDIKLMLQSMTKVPTERQKLIGLYKSASRKVEDSERLTLTELKVKGSVVNFSLIGTPDEDLLIPPDSAQLSNVVNDFCHSFSPLTEEWTKLRTHTESTNIQFITEPRLDKKLLVLDLDHTLLDFSSKEAIPVEEMKRPYMDHFLAEVYQHYDIAIWSQTHWKWLELKLTELGMLTTERFKICFVLDKSSMFKLSTGAVKPLALIWSKYPDIWNRRNTLHIDDLERNFVMNPESGILVTPYYRESSSSSISGSSSSGESSSSPRSAGDQPMDDELLHLARYLVRIASALDLSELKHTNWRKR